MAADSSSSASNVNFDTENDAFNDEIYFGDSRDNVQETEIVSIGVSQRWCGTIQEPAVKRVRHWRRPCC